MAATFTMPALQRMLGLSRGVITRLIDAGYIAPVRGPRNEYRFSFQEVVALRTAHALRHARVPHRRLLRSLRALRQQLPAGMPSSGLRIRVVGDQVAVLDGASTWVPQSGQLLLDFEVMPGREPALVLHLRPTAAPRTADEGHRRAKALEGRDPAAAEAAYREALHIDADHVASYVDLGALLCTEGRCTEAIELYEAALVRLPDDPALHFNAAIALEDLGRLHDALAHYELALQRDDRLADAHFNAARLCEQLGELQRAVRHFSAYGRLERMRIDWLPELP